MNRKTIARAKHIHSRRLYSTKELASLLEVTTKTVVCWVKDGLKCLDDNSRIRFISGSDALDFILLKKTEKKCKLKAEEFYCTRCRTGRKSLPDKIEIVHTGLNIGKGLESIRIRGICEHCGCSINRFCTDKNYGVFKNIREEP